MTYKGCTCGSDKIVCVDCMQDYISQIDKTTAHLYNAGYIPNVHLCAVVDNKGKHCPGTPNNLVKLPTGKVVELCDRCYRSWLNGVWSR